MNKYYKIGALLVSVAVGAALIIVVVRHAPAQQIQPGLTITSPANGTAVTPGQTITVSVTSTGNATFTEVIVIGEDPIGFSQALTAPPYQFQVTIPNNINFRRYRLIANGTLAPGQIVRSAPVNIAVEGSSSVVRFTVEPNIVKLRFVGDQLPLHVYGTFANGSIADITESLRTSYGTNNSGVATVNTSGIVIGTGPGNASIIVNGAFALPVSVPASSRGDLNGDGKVDLDDVRIMQDALNTPATKPTDARDLNGDGVINALDARILVTLCTKPACATQ